MDKKNVVFMAADAIALPLLDFLYAEAGTHNARLAAVVSQPEKPTGRGQKTQKNVITLWAEERGLLVLTPAKPGPETIQELKAIGTDIVLVMAYGHILSRELLAVPPEGVFNFHTSLLPRYRGPSPIAAAIAAGDTVTGISLMRLVPKMDAGPVIDKESVPIEPTHCEATLRERLATACVPLIKRNFSALLAGNSTAVEQDEKEVSYTRLLTKQDSLLDFSAPAEDLERRIRALTPWPGAAFLYNGQTIKIGEAAIQPMNHDAAVPPGTVVPSTNGHLSIATGKGTLSIRMLQRPGGKMLPARAFLNGFPIPVGTHIPSQPMEPLFGQQPFRKNAERGFS